GGLRGRHAARIHDIAERRAAAEGSAVCNESLRRQQLSRCCLNEVAAAPHGHLTQGATAMAIRIAILDDYQNVALKLADWSKLGKDVEIKVYNDAVRRTPEDTIRDCKGFQVISMMRERTPFPRQVIEALPDLKLLITTGARNASIDMTACAERGIVVCGTSSFGNPTTGITFGLILELTRRIGWENARMKAGEKWQVTLGMDIEGKTLGVLGLGKLGTRAAGVGKAFGMNVIAW